MATTLFWKNIGVDIQTALSTAQTISSISKASPGVLTYVGADPANGDAVLLTVNGMAQVNGRIFRVSNVNAGANTFELEGEDTTLYDTFTTGTMQVITFGASFANLMTFTPSGGEYEMTDTSTIHDVMRSQAPSVVSPFTIQSDAKLDVADAGFVEARKAFMNQSMRCMRLRFGTGPKMYFNAFVGAAGIPTGQTFGIVQTKLSFNAQNFPTLLAT